MLQDLRVAIRLIAAHRWFSLAIVVTLALGIGINTTVFTLVNAVLFKPMPFRDGERLVIVSGARRANPDNRDGSSYPEYEAYRDQSSSFEQLEAVAIAGGSTLSETGVPAERYRLARTTPGLFRAFRVEPALGRGLQPADGEPGAPAVVVLSDNVWKTRYNRSPDVIGRAVRLNEAPATIVGVLPPGVLIPNREELWTAINAASKDREDRKGRPYMLVGLLKPGATIASASVDLDVIARRLEADHPDTNKDVTASVETFNQRFNGNEIRLVFLLMLGAVGFVLLITCANVANMLLGRALARQREMSIRAALGASRWQIVRQLLVESLLLSFTGGVLGLGIAYGGITLFDRATQDVGKPSWILFTMDYTVVAYFIAICALAGLIFGLAPALRSSKVDLTVALKEGGRGGSVRGGRLASALVVAQFALAVVLLAGAGLLMRSFVAKARINADLAQREVITARVTLPRARYPDREARRRFFDELLQRVHAVAGVTRAAAINVLPGLGGEFHRFELEGAPAQAPSARPTVATAIVSPDFFPTFDVVVTRGRALDDRDGQPDHEVAVVTAQFVTTYWPNQDPIGRRFRLNDEATPGPWLEVVGVARDFQQTDNQGRPQAVAIMPMRQQDSSSFVIAARTTGDASRLAGALRSEVQRLDLDLAVSEVGTYEALLARGRWVYVVFGSLFSTFAATALLMAGIGLYGVMSQAASRRTREIGIRVALGATPRRVIATVMRGGIISVAAGLVLGLGGAFAATRAMATLLFGVGARDPIVFATVSTILAVVGLVACWLPARRAAHVAPLVALADDEIR